MNLDATRDLTIKVYQSFCCGLFFASLNKAKIPLQIASTTIYGDMICSEKYVDLAAMTNTKSKSNIKGRNKLK
jgi:hypothetical protein